MDGLWWKTLLKWMIWGYLYFRTHPYSWHVFVCKFPMFLLTQLPQVNLLKDAWLLPVHGHGTFADPFEVDISLLELIEIAQQKKRPKTRVQLEMIQDWMGGGWVGIVPWAFRFSQWELDIFATLGNGKPKLWNSYRYPSFWIVMLQVCYPNTAPCTNGYNIPLTFSGSYRTYVYLYWELSKNSGTSTMT